MPNYDSSLASLAAGVGRRTQGSPAAVLRLALVDHQRQPKAFKPKEHTMSEEKKNTEKKTPKKRETVQVTINIAKGTDDKIKKEYTEDGTDEQRNEVVLKCFNHGYKNIKKKTKVTVDFGS